MQENFFDSARSPAEQPLEHVRRSIHEPIREFSGMEHRWRGPDQGLIWCWERGRQIREENPELAQRAKLGELPVLGWRGGVAKKLKAVDTKQGTLRYLAEWQGLRGEDLDIDTASEKVLICTVTGQAVSFSVVLPVDDATVLPVDAQPET
jgi:hypothetical protein